VVWAAVAVVALLIGGGVAAAVSLSGSRSDTPAATTTSVASQASPAAGGQGGGTPPDTAASPAGGSGPLVKLAVQGGAISAISYLDANGEQQTVSKPPSGWSVSFQANGSFREQLRARGTGEIKCTLTIGDSVSQNAADSTSGTTVTCRGLVGN
jgi:hypothetical protein